MSSLDLSSMRHRDGGKKLLMSHSTGYGWTGLDASSPAPSNSQSFDMVTEIEEKDMWDVVVKDFHRRSGEGEIFNNPMHQRELRFTTTNSHVKGAIYYYDSEGKHTFTNWVNDPMVDTIQACQSRRTLSAPTERLQNVALTAAYAGITANTQNAVLWAGEFKETLKMVTDIGLLLKNLTQKTKKQRLEWAKGKLTVPEAQSLTLGLLYGILPLEQSIAQVTEGLFKLKPNGRHTSRGFQVYTDTNSVYDEIIEPGESKSEFAIALAETLEVQVRAGVLYDVDVDDFPSIAIIADPKQVVETAYALARLSFVTDWFINVGNTLMAWAPSVGTKELAAWVTITETYEQRTTYTYDRFNRYLPDVGRYDGGSASGAFSSTYKEVQKTRLPVNRSDLAILPRLNINLNFSKLNSLVLLFADAKKKR